MLFVLPGAYEPPKAARSVQLRRMAFAFTRERQERRVGNEMEMDEGRELQERRVGKEMEVGEGRERQERRVGKEMEVGEGRELQLKRGKLRSIS